MTSASCPENKPEPSSSVDLLEALFDKALRDMTDEELRAVIERIDRARWSDSALKSFLTEE